MKIFLVVIESEEGGLQVRRAFTQRPAAEFAANGMEMFKARGDTWIASVREMDAFEGTQEEYLATMKGRRP